MAKRARDVGPYTPTKGLLAGQTFPSARQYRNALARAKGFTSLSAQQAPRLAARREERREAKGPAVYLTKTGQLWVRVRGRARRQHPIARNAERREVRWNVTTVPPEGVMLPERVQMVGEMGSDGQTLVGTGRRVEELVWTFLLSPPRCCPGGWIAELTKLMERNGLEPLIRFKLGGGGTGGECFEVDEDTKNCGETVEVDRREARDELEIYGRFVFY